MSSELSFNSTNVINAVKWLAHGPRLGVWKYRSYRINGFLYHTKACDDVRVVQNSGVCILLSTVPVSSANVTAPISRKTGFYGVIEEIWELDYHDFRVPLFKCAWVDKNKGVKYDEGLTLVNLKLRGHRKEEFIMAVHVSQVFYIDDAQTPGWSIALPMPTRVYSHGDDKEDILLERQSFTDGLGPVDDYSYAIKVGASKYMRVDCDGIWITNPKKRVK